MSVPAVPIPVRSYTGPEIAEMSEAQPTWLACPWVAQGAITEISGKIKLAGKTTFIAHMADAVVFGEPFLGRPTRPSGVMYLTEQSLGTFRQSLRGTRLLESTDFRAMFLAHFRRAKLAGWVELLLRAGEEAAGNGARVIVIDTLMQMAGVRDENDTGEALRVMEPVQELAAAGFAVVCSRHDRKSGGDVGDSSRGSSAYAGAMDVLVQLSREAGSSSRVRKLEAVSRFEETPNRLMVELGAGGYVVHGRPDEEPAAPADRSERGRTSLLFVLQNDPMTLDEVVGRTDHPKTTVFRWLSELEAAGRIRREGTGTKGDPHRYGFVPFQSIPKGGNGMERIEDGAPPSPRP